MYRLPRNLLIGAFSEGAWSNSKATVSARRGGDGTGHSTGYQGAGESDRRRCSNGERRGGKQMVVPHTSPLSSVVSSSGLCPTATNEDSDGTARAACLQLSGRIVRGLILHTHRQCCVFEGMFVERSISYTSRRGSIHFYARSASSNDAPCVGLRKRMVYASYFTTWGALRESSKNLTTTHTFIRSLFPSRSSSSCERRWKHTSEERSRAGRRRLPRPPSPRGGRSNAASPR